MKILPLSIIAMLSLSTSAVASDRHVGAPARASVQAIVDGTIRPLMVKDGIPGMAVAVTVDGMVHVFDYGVASKSPTRPVTRNTLFEIGSVTKTFTATLAALDQVEGRLSLTDDTAKYVPELNGAEFGKVSLLELATHTPGGLPLQVPDDVTTDAQLIAYFKRWHAAFAPGTMRTYNNPGIGMLGVIAARSARRDFSALMERRVFAALGMTNTFINVPRERMVDYAWGYARDGSPVRLTPGVLWQETYGIRTTAADLMRFVEANLGEIHVDESLHRAIVQTHVGYSKQGPIVQDLIWEQCAVPVSLQTLLSGNSSTMLFKPVPATALAPPLRPQSGAWLDKTGSTNGFGTYVAFVPSKRIGIVMLANKNYPIPDRVAAAYRVLTALTSTTATNGIGGNSRRARRRAPASLHEPGRVRLRRPC